MAEAPQLLITREYAIVFINGIEKRIISRLPLVVNFRSTTCTALL